MAVAAQIPGADLIPETSELFLGFTSTQRAGMGPGRIANFETLGYVDFRGIDPTALDLTTFGTPVDVPVRRQQNEFGINYYFYPRMVLKAAYQVNDERGFHLHDNQFITELAWGW